MSDKTPNVLARLQLLGGLRSWRLRTVRVRCENPIRIEGWGGSLCQDPIVIMVRSSRAFAYLRRLISFFFHSVCMLLPRLNHLLTLPRDRRSFILFIRFRFPICAPPSSNYFADFSPDSPAPVSTKNKSNRPRLPRPIPIQRYRHRSQPTSEDPTECSAVDRVERCGAGTDL